MGLVKFINGLTKYMLIFLILNHYLVKLPVYQSLIISFVCYSVVYYFTNIWKRK